MWCLEWQDKKGNIFLTASHDGLQQSKPWSTFLSLSAPALQTSESREPVNERPHALEVAKTKQLCHGELELGLPLHFLSHGKSECHRVEETL